MENRTSGNLEADHSDRTGNKSLEQLKAELEKEKAHYKELEKDPRKPKEKKKKNTDSSVSPPADPIPYGQLDQFHIMRIKDGKYYPRDTFDYVIVREIKSRYHLFVLNGKAYWYMGGVYKIDDSGTLSQDIIENFIYPEFKDFRHKQKIYKLLLSDYHIQKNIEDINNFPATWINFQNGFYDARQKIFIEHDWKYLSINQIPHDYCEKSVEEIESSITYKYLSDLIPDEADRFMFFQYCGYSMTTDTKFQKFLMITGMGGTGKSVLLRLIQKVCGNENISNFSITEMTDRFSSAYLFGKLCNICADISAKSLEETDGIKKIFGEDTIKAEYKNGAVFFFRASCKAIFSANRIPLNKDEQSNAFYRRLLVLKINQRASYIDDLEKRLEEDIDIFINLVVKAIHDSYMYGEIIESENSSNEILELYKSADSVQAFLSDKGYLGTKWKKERNAFYTEYQNYCIAEDRNYLQNKSFYANMREKGYAEQKTNGNRYFVAQREDTGQTSLTLEDIRSGALNRAEKGQKKIASALEKAFIYKG